MIHEWQLIFLCLICFFHDIFDDQLKRWILFFIATSYLFFVMIYQYIQLHNSLYRQLKVGMINNQALQWLVRIVIVNTKPCNGSSPKFTNMNSCNGLS